MQNITYYIKPEVTEKCWKWCQEQGAIHQSNIDILNLGIVGIAMTAILFYHLINEYEDELVKRLNADRSQLSLGRESLTYFAFILLALFLFYYIFFQ
tara:strand:- start:242 stop:532 length:291 start_codon:yes stop_codon:yes gene_type:complete